MPIWHTWMMNLKHVRTFVAVVEHGTVSSAAAHLRITQPALTRQIQSLQDEVGLKLFNHVNRRLALTNNGEEFLRHCRALVAQADAVLASAQSLGRGKTGVLRIGAAPQTIARFFPSFLQRYERHHPNVRVHLVEASGARQIEMVTKGELHFAITIVFSRQEQLANHPLAPIPLLVLSHSRYALGARSPVDLQRLDGLPLLLGDREQAARATFEAACRLARITPNVRFEGNAPHTLAALAEAGYGVAIVPGTLMVRSKRLRISRLQFRGELVVLPLSVQWDDRRPLPLYAQDFPALFSAHVRSMLRQPNANNFRSGRLRGATARRTG
jgi:DNA-binding transcriptional LysR family regulator